MLSLNTNIHVEYFEKNLDSVNWKMLSVNKKIPETHSLRY